MVSKRDTIWGTRRRGRAGQRAIMPSARVRVGFFFKYKGGRLSFYCESFPSPPETAGKVQRSPNMVPLPPTILSPETHKAAPSSSDGGRLKIFRGNSQWFIFNHLFPEVKIDSTQSENRINRDARY